MVLAEQIKEIEQRREALLRGKPHAVMTEDFFVLESYQMARFGGGYFAAGKALAAVETAGGLCQSGCIRCRSASVRGRS